MNKQTDRLRHVEDYKLFLQQRRAPNSIPQSPFPNKDLQLIHKPTQSPQFDFQAFKLKAMQGVSKNALHNLFQNQYNLQKTHSQSNFQKRPGVQEIQSSLQSHYQQAGSLKTPVTLSQGTYSHNQFQPSSQMQKLQFKPKKKIDLFNFDQLKASSVTQNKPALASMKQAIKPDLQTFKSFKYSPQPSTDPYQYQFKTPMQISSNVYNPSANPQKPVNLALHQESKERLLRSKSQNRIQDQLQKLNLNTKQNFSTKQPKLKFQEQFQQFKKKKEGILQLQNFQLKDLDSISKKPALSFFNQQNRGRTGKLVRLSQGESQTPFPKLSINT